MKTAIALSGGIDSLTAAYLLLQNGYDVQGIHFRTGYESRPFRIPDGIDIPVEIIDIRQAFHSIVVDYFVKTYQSGKTPNPCLLCNPGIKFGIVMEYTRKLGLTQLATGHYARVRRDENGKCRLFSGVDSLKDQSYFLAMLSQSQLRHALFPLGDYRKADIRVIADENGLIPNRPEESQDVCFIKKGGYGDFILDHSGISPVPGPIVNTRGEHIGSHNGLHLFTIGQRRGINCPAAEPYYVVKIDIRNNRLIVGFREELHSEGCIASHVNWICGEPDFPSRVDVKIRYRHAPVPATLNRIGENKVEIRFEKPEAAVTPGQGAVFYRKDEVIGGGWIDFS